MKGFKSRRYLVPKKRQAGTTEVNRPMMLLDDPRDDSVPKPSREDVMDWYLREVIQRPAVRMGVLGPVLVKLEETEKAEGVSSG